jgi:hypothetical protein
LSDKQKVTGSIPVRNNKYNNNHNVIYLYNLNGKILYCEYKYIGSIPFKDISHYHIFSNDQRSIWRNGRRARLKI